MTRYISNSARQFGLYFNRKFILRSLIQPRLGLNKAMASNSAKNFSSNVKVHTNKLISERSPYLLQHAENPVNWYPWNEEALSKAKEENKLIFLSVGYSTCHWCHVMERESFMNQSIADVMNEHFINIKVDREERPDVDRIYMTFVQLTNDSGGWPMSVFLTPDLHPVAGGTYFPPDDRWGRPGFRSILLKMSKRWRENEEELRNMGLKVIDSLKKVSGFEVSLVNELTGGAVPEISCVDYCLQQLSTRFDSEFGGFSMAPKFPQPSNLMFLFHYYSRNRNEALNKAAYDMALLTLEKMSRGGIHDHIGQGFARYSTDDRWHVPHFEKMLYDQAQLVTAYTVAYSLSKQHIFRDMIIDILTYVENYLSHLEGGFYSAEDADSLPEYGSSEKTEGAFYVWTFNEIESLLSLPVKTGVDNISLSDVFCHHYNIRAGGNVDSSNDPHGELLDKNVLIVLGSEKETAEKFGITEEELSNQLKIAHKILLDERNKRPRPHLDDKIVLSWNGLMLSGYAKAAQVLQNDEYKARAIKSAEFIKKYLWLEDSKRLLHCCYVDEEKKITRTDNLIYGFLNDYVFLIRGLLDLYECCHDSSWLEWCETLQDIQNELFWDGEAKVYNLGSPEYHLMVVPQKDDEDGAEPSGNSVTVQNLLRLATFLNRNDYNEKAEQILSVFTSRLSRFPSSLPEMCCSLMFYHDSPTQIIVVENNDNEKTKEILDAIHQYYIPNRIVAVLNGTDSVVYHRLEMAKNMVENSKDGVTVHVCQKRACSLPATSVEEVKTLLSSNRK